MPAPRIIPILLVRGKRLVKTQRFRDPVYVGDPVNAVRIFNDKEVDELVVLDIGAADDGRLLAIETIEDIAGECFMPLCYGGGVRTIDDFRSLYAVGIEKVSVNTAAVLDPSLVRSAADRFGSQSVVVSIDVQRRRRGSVIVTHGGRTRHKLDPVAHAVAMQEAGAGELLLTSVDREGTQSGYDIDLVARVASAVDIPVVANGGAASLVDMATVLADGGAEAAAAGTLFVFHGRHRAVLISYPSLADRDAVVGV